MKRTLNFIVTMLLYSTAVVAQPSQFLPKGIGGGGALFFPSVNPGNEDEFYVSCDMSELFHSANFGLSYSQVNFNKLQVYSNSTYEFTIDPNKAYCIFNDGNEGYPIKTIDGGNTWTRVLAYSVETYGRVYSLKANYHNPSQLLISSYGDILFSNNGGISFSLVKHTANMGAGITMGGVFWDGSNIFIGTNEGVLYSTDGGSSFSVMPTSGITPGQVIWSFAGAKTNGITRFVCIAANSSDTYNGLMPWDYYNFAKAVYTMDDANGSWMSKSTGLNFNSDFIMYAAMAWNDIHTIYLGGNDKLLSAPLVYKSVDGGSSWVKKFNTTNNSNIITAWEGYNGDKNWSWSETCFGISVAPTNSNKVLFGNFSNVQLSSDGGDNWRQAYVGVSDQHPAGSFTPRNKAYHSIGIETTTCWQVFWQTADNMLGCFSDIGGLRSLDSGNSWGYLYSGFAVNSLYRIARDNSGVLYGACSNIHDMYESTRLADAQLDAFDANGKIVYSPDAGATWNTLHTFNHPVFWLATDPTNPNRMYASIIHFGGNQGSQLGGIYKTEDLNNLAGSNWVKLPNPPRTEGHPASIVVLNDGKMVCTFSGRRNPNGVFTASSGVFIYDPSSGIWTDVSDPGMYYWTRDIIVDPNDPAQNTWYAGVFSGWGGAPNGLGGLYRTTNRGTSWTKLTGSQFDRVTCISFNPQEPTQAYLTTETQGLWLLSGMNNELPTYSQVASYPFRQPERVFFNPFNPDEMWVTSFGNGLKIGKLSWASGVDPSSIQIGKEMEVLPNPSNGEFLLKLFSEVLCKATLVISSVSGEQILTSALSLQPGLNLLPVRLVTAKKGIFILHVQSNSDLQTKKIIVE